MNFTYNSFSHALNADKNQDSIIEIPFSSNHLFVAVADGVGGREGGEVASKIAVEVAGEKLANTSSCSFEEVFKDIVTEFKKVGAEDSNLKKMATTLTLVIFSDRKAHFAHVGDSCIYH